MIRKDVVYLAIILILLGIVAVTTCQSPEVVDSERDRFKDSVKVLQSQKATLQALQATIISDARLREKEYSSKLAASLREITRLKVKASTRRPQVQPVIDSIPALKAFVAVLDSTILTQSILIDTLKAQVGFERMTREQLTALHYDSDKINAQLQELSEQRIIGLEKDLKKEKRKGKLFKAVAIVGTIAGFVLGSQL